MINGLCAIAIGTIAAVTAPTEWAGPVHFVVFVLAMICGELIGLREDLRRAREERS